jgi:hypothetical protein
VKKIHHENNATINDSHASLSFSLFLTHNRQEVWTWSQTTAVAKEPKKKKKKEKIVSLET